jgi:hypothetical protein
MDAGVTEIICLVRASNVTEARTRVLQGLEKRRLDYRTNLDHRIIYVPAQLDQANLGLSEERYSMLRQTVTDIIHVSIPILKPSFQPACRLDLGCMGSQLHPPITLFQGLVGGRGKPD